MLREAVLVSVDGDRFDVCDERSDERKGGALVTLITAYNLEAATLTLSPSSVTARQMRVAISPRFAARILVNGGLEDVEKKRAKASVLKFARSMVIR